MKYFRPIQSGLNKGFTFWEYLRNNTLPYIIGVVRSVAESFQKFRFLVFGNGRKVGFIFQKAFIIV